MNILFDGDIACIEKPIGDIYCRKEAVMTKELFVACYERWIKGMEPSAPETLKGIKAGDRFKWCGVDFVCLDPDYEEDGQKGIFCIVAEFFKDGQAFDEDNCNNYAESDIRRCILEEFLPKLDQTRLIAHKVDLTSDAGEKDYGFVKDKAFLISCDEYRKYREFIPKYGDWWWTCTPWSVSVGYAYVSRYVHTSGSLDLNVAYIGNGASPACIIKSI